MTNLGVPAKRPRLVGLNLPDGNRERLPVIEQDFEFVTVGDEPRKINIFQKIVDIEDYVLLVARAILFFNLHKTPLNIFLLNARFLLSMIRAKKAKFKRYLPL